MFKKFLTGAVLVGVMGCAAGLLLPFISPLLETVAEYVLGETEEEEFIQDLVTAAIEGDPVKVVWTAADEIQRKYVLGTVARQSSLPDSLFRGAEADTSGTEPEIVLNLMTSLTFVGGILFDMNSEDPDTTLGEVPDPPEPPDPDDEDLLECLKDCLDLPPGRVSKCVEACNGA